MHVDLIIDLIAPNVSELAAGDIDVSGTVHSR